MTIVLWRDEPIFMKHPKVKGAFVRSHFREVDIRNTPNIGLIVKYHPQCLLIPPKPAQPHTS